MENNFKRFLSLVLAIVMVICMMPANFAFATEDDGAAPDTDATASEPQATEDSAAIVTDPQESEPQKTEDPVAQIDENVSNTVKVTVTVNDATKVAGNPDPEFTYTTDVELDFDLDITYTVDGNTINATVAEMEGYEFTVIPGKLTVEACIATVDGVPYSVWTEAMAAIKGDSVIVLQADVVNNGSFSKGAMWKTLTLDLNGHNFTTTTIGQGNHYTLHITDSAAGGSVNVTSYVALYPNGYLNVDSDVDFNTKIQIGYHPAGSTGCLLVDGVKLIGRGHFEQNDGIFGTTGGDVYLTGGAQNINFMRGSFILNADYEIKAGETVTISQGTTLTVDAVLTLNAASNVTINGTVKGEGKVAVNTLDQFNVILGTDVVNIELGSAIVLDDELRIDEQVTVTGMANLSVSENGELILTAGTYDMDVQQYCPAGYYSNDNFDGTWTVLDHIPVTVTVNDVSMVEGNPIPTEFTYTINRVLDFDLDITFSVDTENNTINATVENVEPYRFTVVPGNLIVEKALVRVYAANNAKVMYFASLNEAMEYAVAQNDYVPIFLLDNITLTETIVIADDRNNAMELQGSKTGGNTFTLTSDFDGPMFQVESGLLNVKNLIIDAKGDAFYVTGGTLNLNYHSVGRQFIEVTSQTGNCVYIRGGNVNVNGAKLTSLGEYPAIQGNGNYAGNVTITRWNIGDGIYPVISAPNTDMAIYWPGNGKLTVEGGTITGDTALYAKSGTIVINGGEFIATGDKVAFQHYSNGAYATGDAVVVEACSDAAYETPVVTITGGTFTSANAEAVMFYACDANADAKAIMELSGGIYSSKPDVKWCAEGMGPKHYGENQWTVGTGVISVDDVWFDSWDEAEYSIKKNSVIVLHADVTNTYGGTVLKDFKFPTNGGNITLNLNGHTFKSAMSEASKMTTVTVQYGTVLNIIGGGSIVIENNSYPFVINPKSTVKIEEGITFIGTMQWNVNNGNSGNLYIGETAMVGVNGVFKPTATTRIIMNEQGDWTLGMGKLTMTADDATLANNTLTINKNTSIDLCGHNLTAKNIAAFGNLIDSEDGVGTVTATGAYYYTNHSNMDYLPLYDSTNGYYRLYATEVKTRGVKVVNENTLKYGYTVYFNDAEAYKLLGEMAASHQFSMAASWTDNEMGFTYNFTDALLSKFAAKAYEQMMNNGKVTTSMTLNINGMDTLVSGDIVTTIPAIAAQIGVVVSGEVHEYTIS